MGTFTNKLLQIIGPMPELPATINSMIRLGGEGSYSGLALPVEEQGAIVGFDLWLCEIRKDLDRLRYTFVPRERVGDTVSIWQLRRWQQRITKMTRRDGARATKASFGIWQVATDYGEDRPTVVRTGPDLRVVLVEWPHRLAWCTVSPINPAVRRAGL